MIATMGVMVVLHFSSMEITFPETVWGIVFVGIVVQVWVSVSKTI